MTDAATFWPLACEALAEGDFEQAFALLQAGNLLSPPAEQARYALLAGALHALYGDLAVEELNLSLSEARRLDPALSEDPLWLALSAEAAARAEGPQAAPPPAAALAAADPLARFHALSALVLAGRLTDAVMLTLDPAELPAHLSWRAAALQAEAHEGLGDSAQAAELFAQAAVGARGPDRAVMLQEGAALRLAQGQLDAAAQALAEARALYSAQPSDPQEALNLSTWHYLQAQVQLAQGQADTALSEIEAAAGLEVGHGDPSYGVALVRGQALNALGRSEEALASFGRAAELAQEGDRAYAQHELAVALLDLDRPLEAQEVLEAVARDPSYPFQAEILADLAECDYRLGQLAQAQAGAEQALRQGAVVPASLVLGNVALEYYHLDDALAHFERVIGASPEGSRDWLIGHQMTADILAQQGFREPAQVYAHAQQALEHTPEGDDWQATLQAHRDRAAELMQGGGGRVLN
ncbi:hypothetical protein GCM10017783_11010 [Deinococcus piscis]|uniref:Tetratricopeptide repeat protein n=1 Tax=Deinococcus piscis TaxID=394230 RepID=A0ABQ3K4L1_9DEIO|nr:hypothetical protein [Deinococcus piscis]GHG00648.1 hypothetical protein GCM10017783_11010 [Deinococcus piscis]